MNEDERKARQDEAKWWRARLKMWIKARQVHLSAEMLMDAVAMVQDEGLWKFDQPKWYEAVSEAITNLQTEAGYEQPLLRVEDERLAGLGDK